MSYQLDKTKFLLEPEFKALTETLERNKTTDERNCTLLWLLLFTGARATEILNLTPADINHAEKSVLIRGIKGSKNREIPLKAWLYFRIAKITGEKLFPIGYQRLKQIWDNYRPAPKKLHATRHTFAIRLYEKTKDIRLVQTALGHRSITNTMVYADYSYSQKELRKLIL